MELGSIILRISLLTGIIFTFLFFLLQNPLCIAQILNCHYRKYSANNILSFVAYDKEMQAAKNTGVDQSKSNPSTSKLILP